MPFIESPKEFMARMNCRFIEVEGGYLFENGGRYLYGLRYEPPTDPAERLVLSIDYESKLLERAENRFTNCSNYIDTQSQYYALGAGPAPEDKVFADLKRFQEEVLILRKNVEALQTEYRKLIGPTPADRRAAQNAKRVEEAEALRIRGARIRI